METFNDLKQLWNKQASTIPDVIEFLRIVKAFKRTRLLKLIGLNVLLTVTIFFIIWIWLYFKPQFLTTKIGIVLIVASMIIFLIPYNKQIRLLYTNTIELSSHDYLAQLLALQKAQSFQQTKMLNSYFVLLALGICLYLIEYVYQMEAVLGISIYGLTILWICFNWLYLRPRIIKQQNEKLQNLILGLKQLVTQMDETSTC